MIKEFSGKYYFLSNFYEVSKICETINGKGQNNLGKILMRVREELQ